MTIALQPLNHGSCLQNCKMEEKIDRKEPWVWTYLDRNFAPQFILSVEFIVLAPRNRRLDILQKRTSDQNWPTTKICISDTHTWADRFLECWLTKTDPQKYDWISDTQGQTDFPIAARECWKKSTGQHVKAGGGKLNPQWSIINQSLLTGEQCASHLRLLFPLSLHKALKINARWVKGLAELCNKGTLELANQGLFSSCAETEALYTETIQDQPCKERSTSPVYSLPSYWIYNARPAFQESSSLSQIAFATSTRNFYC